MKQHLTAPALLILTLALLPAGRLAAQGRDFDKIAPESLPAAPMETTSAPVAAKPTRVFDKKFFMVMGALGGAESFRFTSRQLVLDHEYAAGAPWVTSPPANQPVMARGLALYAAEFLVTYELKKPHSWLPGDRVIRRLWWAYPATMSAIHIKNAVGNVRTQGPGGCTSIECAEQMQ
ncbi:MAG: hypothetical protein WBQ85_00615 [Candidatus Sulfotelmatobacter sp.]